MSGPCMCGDTHCSSCGPLLEADRKPKTQINRDGRNYRFTVKE